MQLLFGYTLLLSVCLTATENQPVQYSHWIQQLGSPKFQKREAASQFLLDADANVLQLLRKGTQSKDPEIAERCRELVPQLVEKHLDRLLAEYQRDENSKLAKELPCLKQWLQVAGTSEESKKLYGQLIKLHVDSLLIVDRDQDAATDAYFDFGKTLYALLQNIRDSDQRFGVLSRTELAHIFFLGSLANRQNVNTQSQTMIAFYSILSQRQLRDDLEATGSEPMRRLFVGWLRKETNTTLIRRGIGLALNAQLKEAAPLALDWAKDKGQLGTVRGNALMLLAKAGTRQQIPEIEKLLEDHFLVTNMTINGGRITIEVRDCALAACLLITKQDPEDYFFATGRQSFGTMSYMNYIFETDENRTKALEKWKEWRKKN